MNQPTVNLKFPKDFFKNYARGKPCLVRMASSLGHQCSGPETTVLSHGLLPGYKAMGSRKASLPDLCGAWACGNCHDLYEGRLKPAFEVADNAMDLWHGEGVLRTIAQLVKDGVLPNPV